MEFETYQCETSMHKKYWEDINALMMYAYECDNDWQPSPEEKWIERGKYNNEQMYKEVFYWEGMVYNMVQVS